MRIRSIVLPLYQEKYASFAYLLFAPGNYIFAYLSKKILFCRNPGKYNFAYLTMGK